MKTAYVNLATFLFFLPFAALMIVGVIPFTPAAVAALIVLSHVEWKLTWCRR